MASTVSRHIPSRCKKVTLLINREVTRRACVMQLIAMVGGEIEYDGYSIGIRKHIGSETAIDIMKSSLVQDISYSHNVSENTTTPREVRHRFL